VQSFFLRSSSSTCSLCLNHGHCCSLVGTLSCFSLHCQRGLGHKKPAIKAQSIEGSHSDSSHGLNLLETVRELVPVLHVQYSAVVHQHLARLIGLGRVMVASSVRDRVDAGPDSAERAALAVLDSDALLRLDADLLAREQVDGRVRLGGRRGQARGGAEDVAVGEVLGLADLLDGGLDAAQRGRADDRHAVLLRVVDLLQLFVGADARLRLRVQRRDHPVLLHLHVALALRVGHGEVVLGLQALDHAAEVLADEGRHQLRAGVAFRDIVLLEDLVAEPSTSLKGQFLREDKRVVAVEEELLDLERFSVTVAVGYAIQSYHRHFDVRIKSIDTGWVRGNDVWGMEDEV